MLFLASLSTNTSDYSNTLNLQSLSRIGRKRLQLIGSLSVAGLHVRGGEANGKIARMRCNGLLQGPTPEWIGRRG